MAQDLLELEPDQKRDMLNLHVRFLQKLEDNRNRRRDICVGLQQVYIHAMPHSATFYCRLDTHMCRFAGKTEAGGVAVGAGCFGTSWAAWAVMACVYILRISAPSPACILARLHTLSLALSLHHMQVSVDCVSLYFLCEKRKGYAY